MSVKFFARNSRAGNGCTPILSAPGDCVDLSAGKPSMPIKVLVLGVGVFGFWGGGEVPISFLWVQGFF